MNLLCNVFRGVPSSAFIGPGRSGCKRSAARQRIWSCLGGIHCLAQGLFDHPDACQPGNVSPGHLVEDLKAVSRGSDAATDCELFVSEILQDEDLSENAQETRQVLLNNFRVVHVRNPEEFPFPPSDFRDDEGSDDNRSSSLGRSAPSDDASVASDYQDDGAPEYFGDIPPVAAQDLGNILKQGHLEKKRRDHSFFGSEWQKRWCVLNNSIFYYFGSEKDKQQKGSFYIIDYSVQLVTNLRKDSKKTACFELLCPGRRAFQFTASSPQEAREWVDQINFVLRDLRSTSIPCDDDEEEDAEEEEETYDDIEAGPHPPRPRAAQASQSSKLGGGHEAGEVDEEDEDIYEVLPEEDFPDLTDESSEKNNKPASSSDYANYYQGLWDCQADEPDELPFQRGDLIYIISKALMENGGMEWEEIYGTNPSRVLKSLASAAATSSSFSPSACSTLPLTPTRRPTKTQKEGDGPANPEYNIHGWWVGELNGTVGIVPKDFLHPAYIL